MSQGYYPSDLPPFHGQREPKEYCAVCSGYKIMEEFPYGQDENPETRSLICTDCWEVNPAEGKLFTPAPPGRSRNGTFDRKNTRVEYEHLAALQGRHCQICGQDEKTQRLAVDHDHETEITRGLLCSRCNLLIGSADESPAILRAAASYLESHAG